MGGAATRDRRRVCIGPSACNLERAHVPAPRRHSHHRLRFAVHPAHRAARARGARVLRDPSAHAHGRVDPRVEAPGIILSGGPDSVYGEHVPTADPALLEMAPGARRLLRHAAVAHLSAARVIAASRREYGRADVDGAGRTSVRWLREGRGDAGLDEPRRSRRRRAAGLRRDRVERQLPIAAFEHDDAASLRRAVPSRSGAHAARRRDHRQLPLRCVRLHARLDAGHFVETEVDADSRDWSARRGASSAVCPAGWTRRSPRRWCIARSATG